MTKAKKLGILLLVLVIAMVGLGVGYAHWSKTLTITENINTGKLCVGIRDVGTNDPGPSLRDGGVLHPVNSPVDGTQDPGYTKNVASTNSENIGDVVCTKGVTPSIEYYYGSVTETIRNAYPSYHGTITLEIYNCGTIPVNIKWTNAVTGDAALAPYIEITFWEVFRNTVSIQTGTSADTLIPYMTNFQVDPLDTIKLVFTKHITQEVGGVMCPQDTTVTYTHTVTATQWNVP